MTQRQPPAPPPNSLPEESPARLRRRSRYDRPRTYISWFGLVLGLAFGIGAGLYYTWNIAPIEEVDTAPWQLHETDRNHYLVAVMLKYTYDGDLGYVINQLELLRLPGRDPIQQVADIACDLASSGYVDSGSGLRAIRSMMTFYQAQGRSSCADTLIPADESVATPVVAVVLPTPTLRPPATKTPTPPGTAQPSPTPSPPFVPTAPPSRAFELVQQRSFCSVEISGVIEVFVQNFNSQGIPGQPVRVRWSDGESTFFTGLKPERGPGYADFLMEPGRSYVIEMPGLSDPSTAPMVANNCPTESGETAVTSYRVVFRGG